MEFQLLYCVHVGGLSEVIDQNQVHLIFCQGCLLHRGAPTTVPEGCITSQMTESYGCSGKKNGNSAILANSHDKVHARIC